MPGFPAHLHLPFEEWPKIDQDLWTAATNSDDPFGDAMGAGLAPATLKRYMFGWRRFLGFLAVTDSSALHLPPADRITKERVRSFADHLATTNTSRSVALQVEALYQAARVMISDQDWSWLKSMKTRLHTAAPKPAARGPVITSVQLLDLGLELMAEVAIHPGKLLRLRDAVQYRDGLMIAFLALIPIRRKNLAAIEIGRDLIREGEGWLVAFSTSKTKEPIEFEIPEILAEHLTKYFDLVRVRMLRDSNRSAFWISAKGCPLSYSAVWGAITRHTFDRLGIHVAPHDFRDAAATTWAIGAPDQIGVARDLLGHRVLRTLTRHYNRATGVKASRSFAHLLASVKTPERFEQ